jgi:hypothetical protein
LIFFSAKAMATLEFLQHEWINTIAIAASLQMDYPRAAYTRA